MWDGECNRYALSLRGGEVETIAGVLAPVSFDHQRFANITSGDQAVTIALG